MSNIEPEESYDQVADMSAHLEVKSCRNGHLSPQAAATFIAKYTAA